MSFVGNYKRCLIAHFKKWNLNAPMRKLLRRRIIGDALVSAFSFCWVHGIQRHCLTPAQNTPICRNIVCPKTSGGWWALRKCAWFSSMAHVSDLCATNVIILKLSNPHLTFSFFFFRASLYFFFVLRRRSKTCDVAAWLGSWSGQPPASLSPLFSSCIGSPVISLLTWNHFAYFKSISGCSAYCC